MRHGLEGAKRSVPVEAHGSTKEVFDRNETGLPGDRGRQDRVIFAASPSHESNSDGDFWGSGADAHTGTADKKSWKLSSR